MKALTAIMLIFALAAAVLPVRAEVMCADEVAAQSAEACCPQHCCCVESTPKTPAPANPAVPVTVSKDIPAPAMALLPQALQPAPPSVRDYSPLSSHHDMAAHDASAPLHVRICVFVL